MKHVYYKPSGMFPLPHVALEASTPIPLIMPTSVPSLSGASTFEHKRAQSKSRCISNTFLFNASQKLNLSCWQGLRWLLGWCFTSRCLSTRWLQAAEDCPSGQPYLWLGCWEKKPSGTTSHCSNIWLGQQPSASSKHGLRHLHGHPPPW